MHNIACVNVYLKWIAIYLLLSTITKKYTKVAVVMEEYKYMFSFLFTNWIILSKSFK